MSDAYGAGAAAQAVANVAVALIQADIARQQIKVANKAEARLTKAADQLFERSQKLDLRYDNKFVPIEDKLLTSIDSQLPYEPKYDTAANRSRAFVRSSFSDARKKIQDCQDTFCIGATCASDRQIAMVEAAALADISNAAIRIEDARKDAFDDRDYSRRVNATNMGRGFRADAEAGLRTSAQLWQQIGQAAGQSASASIRGFGDSLTRAFYQGPQRRTNPTSSSPPPLAYTDLNPVNPATGDEALINQNFAQAGGPSDGSIFGQEGE
jgi:hypothetical protein